MLRRFAELLWCLQSLRANSFVAHASIAAELQCRPGAIFLDASALRAMALVIAGSYEGGLRLDL